jgi:DNA-binding CsgD family transcriptional regulator
VTGNGRRNGSAIDPPAGLAATVLEIGGDEYYVFQIPKPNGALPDALTDAEREVVALVLEGSSNADIARQRSTSTRTVANQIASILRKLAVKNRSELVHRLLSART